MNKEEEALKKLSDLFKGIGNSMEATIQKVSEALKPFAEWYSNLEKESVELVDRIIQEETWK